MPPRHIGALLASVLALLVLAPAASATGLPYPPGAAVDYQLGGSYTPAAGTGIVERDSTDQPVPGTFSICYVNGFQTQPGSRWPARLVLRRHGGPLTDPGWPDEHILDTSTQAKRHAIATRLGRTLSRCAARGFDAVELDNLDSYTRSRHLLRLRDNVRMARLLTRYAHGLGLLVAQKNTAEHSSRLRTRVGFDLAVAEECVAYHECADYAAVYGDHVIDIEYAKAADQAQRLQQLCADPTRPASTVLRDRDLVAVGRPGYVYGRCG